MQVKLVMFNEAGERQDFTLPEGIATLGRGEECDIRVPLPGISRRHCQIVQEDEDIVMRDLGSTNGTFHNNQRAQEATLEPGDHLRLGDVIFTVVINDKPAEITPVRTFVHEDGGEDDRNDAVEVFPNEGATADLDPADEESVERVADKASPGTKKPGGKAVPVAASEEADADFAGDARDDDVGANDPLAALAALNKQIQQPKRK